ncbi:MAG: hypothetical protein ABL958_05155 [Bdellovibrionia bacterium]
MKFQSIFYVALIVLGFQNFIPSPTFADSKVQSMGDAFVKSLPATWSAVPGTWNYFDAVNCYLYQSTCYGNNPSSPYGYPSFADESGSQLFGNFHFEKSTAVVMFLRTPPEVRYFGFTQYLATRGNGEEPFASLGDTLNHLEIATLSSSSSGSGVFNQYAVIVWTADEQTLSDIKIRLSQQGVPDSAVNFIPLPVKFPLHLGSDSNADTFVMLMRAALPTNPSSFEQYTTEKPFYILKVTPDSATTRIPTETIPYAQEGSGVAEDPSLASALDALVSDIKSKYRRGYSFNDLVVGSPSWNGWLCIRTGLSCAGDNHDALYTFDMLQPLTVSNLQDFVVVAGVNHQKTGKALYINHSVYDTVKSAGIVSVDDRKLTTESAIYHAGVTLTNDPRRAQYAQLYAYLISYDCHGLEYCLQIPAPTPSNPIGLEPGAPFRIGGRYYVDPKTQGRVKVRPVASEVVIHKVFIGTAR